MSSKTTNLFKNVYAEWLLERIKINPDFYRLFGPTFYKMNEEQKQSLFTKFSELQTKGISIKEIERVSEDLYNLQPTNIIGYIMQAVKWISDRQITFENTREGSWKLLKKDDLMNIDETLYKDAAEAIDTYVIENGEYIPNAWTNSIITLILIKWLSIRKYWFSKDLEEGVSLNEVKTKITKSRDWLKSNMNQVDSIKGWSPFIPPINNTIINTYDTSMAYIALTYGSKTWQDIDNFEVQEVIQSLLSPILRDKDSGAWYVHNKNGKIDIGATSYALVALIKYNEIKGGKNFAEHEIIQGIKWLAQSQNVDNCGWGENPGMSSRIDMTCYALMALMKYVDIYKHDEYMEKIFKGIKFLYEKCERFTNYDDIYSWPTDDKYQGQHPCFKNSSLVLSTLLRCRIPIYNSEIRRGVSGLLRIYKTYIQKFDESQEKTLIDSLDKAYFLCMLEDYLKAWINV